MLRLPTEELRSKALKTAAQRGYTVQQTEALVERVLSARPKPKRKLMVKDALEYFIGEKLVKYEGPSTLNIQLNAQEEKNRDVLHILHYITEKRSEDIYTVEDKIPLYDLEIQVNTDGKQVKEVRSVPDETPLSFVQEGKYVKFSVKKVDGHQMICIQY